MGRGAAYRHVNMVGVHRLTDQVPFVYGLDKASVDTCYGAFYNRQSKSFITGHYSSYVQCTVPQNFNLFPSRYFFYCSRGKVDHKQELHFLLYLLG